ncbi:hypothetical protein COU76_04160 [Candidatus Peregrinibacteria bacterium CG10_big_fil_rev_8_21_14_0_10_49_10]|nr:MAG: hypothetical protein COU76_04160 [Candidatus Peregrinibacteria bacterium CG10_big_fil_rev_8_21_14_0_10_49_10]
MSETQNTQTQDSSERWPDLNLPETDTRIAAQALLENWGQSYSSPQDADTSLPNGTIDLCGGGDQPFFIRVWCEDGTARNVPNNVFPQIEEENRKMNLPN